MTSPVICIDCSPLLVRSAGVQTYLYHWLKALREQRPGAIRTFLAPASLGELSHDGGLGRHPAKLFALVALNRLPGIFCDVAVPRCDIFHCTNLLRRPPRRARLTATLHDLTPWLLPECHTAAIVASDRVFAERVLRPAAGIIAVSESTRRDAIRILGLPPEKIHVVHSGVSDCYFDIPREAIEGVRISQGLQRPYFLFVGTIEPRKNVDTLLDAWDAMPLSFRQENELIVVGRPGWRADDTMRRLIQANRDAAGVRYLGYVPEVDLPGLTAGARAFVYPSLYEGFGLPVAQAMAAGCPVITSNVSSLPEITGDAAMLVDPRSADELRGAMMRMGDSSELRADLSSRGTARAKHYRWERAAADSLRFFDELS